MPAHERREEVVRVAIPEFGRGGYHGTPTDSIAQAAGLSQPYLFRLFGTKRDLFLACHEDVHRRIADTFETAAADGAGAGTAREPHALARMGKAYIGLLSDRDLLLFQMQAYAACSDPEIQLVVRERYGETVRLVSHLSGASEDELWSFFSTGMLLNVVASLDLGAIASREPWAARWLHPDVPAPAEPSGDR